MAFIIFVLVRNLDNYKISYLSICKYLKIEKNMIWIKMHAHHFDGYENYSLSRSYKEKRILAMGKY